MRTRITRAIVVVLDGVGIGEAPDAVNYGDEGSNSIANTARVLGGLDLPNMGKLGLGRIIPIDGIEPVDNPDGAFGKMTPQSAGKDTVSGHWELMGICLREPFPLYPNGFPPEIISEFKKNTHCGDVLGNKQASGTEIIQELGEAHISTGFPIIYTSADSVFQIAAHEDVIPIERLYQYCQTAREILQGPHGVGRVIARPFLGSKAGEFWRTERRRDYSLAPPMNTLLDWLENAGKEVVTVGKLDDIFSHRGIARSYHTTNNRDSTATMLDLVSEHFEGLLFVNLVEFDMVYGHRNNPEGYAAALKVFDSALSELIERMLPTDIAMIVADHGVDPTTPSTDHSREYVPLLVFGAQAKGGVDLGTRTTFGDVAATIDELFSLHKIDRGTSFLKDILT